MLRDVMTKIPEADRAGIADALRGLDQARIRALPTSQVQRGSGGPATDARAAATIVRRDFTVLRCSRCARWAPHSATVGISIRRKLYYRQVVRITSTLSGAAGGETLRLYQVLSMVLEQKGELEEAESLARRAQALGERSAGPISTRPRGCGEKGEFSSIAVTKMNPSDCCGAGSRSRVEVSRQDGSTRAITRTSLRTAGGTRHGGWRGVLPGGGCLGSSATTRITDLRLRRTPLPRLGSAPEGRPAARRRATVAPSDWYRAQLADGHPDRAGAATGLGAVLLDLGRPTKAAGCCLREGLGQVAGRRGCSRSSASPRRQALLDRALSPPAP